MAFEEKLETASVPADDRELLEHYLSGTGDKLAKLSAAISAARGGGAGSKDELRDALHKLAGSLGTYGFGELGEVARELEKRVRRADEPLLQDILVDTIALRHDVEPAFEEARTRLGPPASPALSAVREKLVVAVIGGGLEDPRTDEAAKAVGRALAHAGAHPVCGGLGGCMEEAACGYREANGGGIVIGILPGPSRHEANPWIDLPIPTGVGQAQAALVAMAADGAIVVGGGGGTLSEIGLLLRDGKPVVALSHTGGAAEMVGGRSLYKQHVIDADDAEQAVFKLLQ